jgi:hypothetical protein
MEKASISPNPFREVFLSSTIECKGTGFGFVNAASFV